LLTLVIAALRNEKGAPLYAVVGAPMRGLSGGDRKQHLAAWRLEPWTADALRIMSAQFSEHGELREIGDKAEAILLEWANTAPVAWAWVREARSEVTIRRDRGSPAEVFAGRTVAVWGCGALGAHVAEFLARAGVKKLVLRDQSDVAPGILVRQPFEDQDVGLSKALSVAERVRRIDARIEAVGLNGNLLTHPLGEDDWADGADVVIDASASIPVLEKLELQRIRSARDPVPMISMTIDHKAERGLLVVSSGSHTGGPFDVTRRAKLEACQRAELREFADAFWPGSDTQRQPIFQPEPGCSASTFIGSATDLSALAASMLNLAAADLTKAFASVSDPHTANAHLITLPHVSIGTGMVRQASFAISSDVVSFDAQTDYEIRIARGAWHEMQGWIERGRRTLGATVETGGVLFGERNDACRILWVSELIGPPPDSSSAVEGFVCGVAGVAAANNEKGKRTRGSAVFVGMWHTHPNDAPLPSLTDLRGMATIVRGAGTNPAKALLAIVGRTTRPMPALGTFLFTRDEFSGFDLLDSDDSAFSEEHSNGSDISPEATRPVYARICDIRRAPRPLPPRKVGLALSGGGSRAIAFHLGCLRALHDRGILSQVSVLSTVSGGSIVGAMYAYSSNDFANFDDRVVRLLRSGLFGSLARRMLVPRDLFGSLGTVITAGLAAAAADFLRTGVRAGMAVFGGRDRARPSWADRIQPPFPRWRSRSTTLEAMLRDRLFGDTSVRNVTRSRLDVVINATELCTGTAFRFGNRGSGSSRFGALAEPDTSVALAVASSAAYPALLPAIDRRLRFRGNDGVSERRVLLADGGLYDNLGTLCMEPGRTESVSQHVYDPEYIIACDAGIGVVSGDSLPYWWGPRMRASFETLFRRVQNSTRNRLHEHAAMGKISGFVLPYLGQQDDRLPWTPPDLVRRETVVSYPTDFSPMSDKYITLLSRRGEQLTRLLLAHYCTEL
jgi:integrative and conjugative element protein (TIGR02256 family)